MTGRPPKDYQLTSLKMDKDLAEKLDLFCKTNGVSKTEIIERSLENFMMRYEKHPLAVG